MRAPHQGGLACSHQLPTSPFNLSLCSGVEGLQTSPLRKGRLQEGLSPFSCTPAGPLGPPGSASFSFHRQKLKEGHSHPGRPLFSFPHRTPLSSRSGQPCSLAAKLSLLPISETCPAWSQTCSCHFLGLPGPRAALSRCETPAWPGGAETARLHTRAHSEQRPLQLGAACAGAPGFQLPIPVWLFLCIQGDFMALTPHFVPLLPAPCSDPDSAPNQFLLPPGTMSPLLPGIRVSNGHL